MPAAALHFHHGDRLSREAAEEVGEHPGREEAHRRLRRTGLRFRPIARVDRQRGRAQGSHPHRAPPDRLEEGREDVVEPGSFQVLWFGHARLPGEPGAERLVDACAGCEACFLEDVDGVVGGVAE